jgi:hypothetical protein
METSLVYGGQTRFYLRSVIISTRTNQKDEIRIAYRKHNTILLDLTVPIGLLNLAFMQIGRGARLIKSVERESVP